MEEVLQRKEDLDRPQNIRGVVPILGRDKPEEAEAVHRLPGTQVLKEWGAELSFPWIRREIPYPSEERIQAPERGVVQASDSAGPIPALQGKEQLGETQTQVFPLGSALASRLESLEF